MKLKPRCSICRRSTAKWGLYVGEESDILESWATKRSPTYCLPCAIRRIRRLSNSINKVSGGLEWLEEWTRVILGLPRPEKP